MCDLISWIEHKGETLFLTDKEVFSKEGNKLAKKTGCMDDMLGHGMIRKYYGIRVEAGLEFEDTRVWEVHRYPKKIQKLIATPKLFEKNFGEMLKECCNYSDIEYIFNHAPFRYKAILWKNRKHIRERLFETSSAGIKFDDIIKEIIFYIWYYLFYWDRK